MMGDYEKVRGSLGEAALRLRFVMLALGLVPLFYLVVQVVLAFAIPADSLAELRDAVPGVLLAVVFAVLSVLAVTVVPRLVYATSVKRAPASVTTDPSRQPVGLIAVFLALAITPSDLGLALFFLTGFWVTVPFHLLGLFCAWRFNLGIEKFLDGMAGDMTAGAGA